VPILFNRAHPVQSKDATSFTSLCIFVHLCASFHIFVHLCKNKKRLPFFGGSLFSVKNRRPGENLSVDHQSCNDTVNSVEDDTVLFPNHLHFAAEVVNVVSFAEEFNNIIKVAVNADGCSLYGQFH